MFFVPKAFTHYNCVLFEFVGKFEFDAGPDQHLLALYELYFGKHWNVSNNIALKYIKISRDSPQTHYSIELNDVQTYGMGWFILKSYYRYSGYDFGIWKGKEGYGWWKEKYYTQAWQYIQINDYVTAYELEKDHTSGSRMEGMEEFDERQAFGYEE